VGKGHRKPASAAGERNDKVVHAVGAVGKWEVALGGTGKASSRLKDPPKKDWLLNEKVARNVEFEVQPFTHLRAESG